MRGLLKSKTPLHQFLILISVALASFFLLGLVFTLLLSKITGIGILEMSDPANWNYQDPRVLTLIRGMQLVQFISLFLVPAIICARLFSHNSKQYLGLRAPSINMYFLVGIAIMLLSLPFVNLLGQLNQSIPLPKDLAEWMKKQEDEAARTIKALLSRRTVGDLILNIFFIAGLAAVGEELLFRGLVQRILSRLFKSAFAGILVAAIIFSAMHMQFYGFFPRLILGIVLGYIYWYSGSLWVAMLAHFVYDAFLIVLVYFNPSSLTDDNTLALNNLALAGALSLGAVIALFVWMKRNSKTTYEAVYAADSEPEKDHPF